MVIAVNLWDNSPKVLFLSATADFYDRFALSQSFQSVIRNDAPGRIRRNMPEPIPVMVLGRLAVDINHQNKGLGKGLVKDALMRTLQASEIVGIRAILVHAVDEEAKKFYVERCGFIPSPNKLLNAFDSKKRRALISGLSI